MNPALDILLVEDDAVFASVLARSLQRRGHRVVLAADVVQARERLSGQAFTHAILDLKLAQESSLPLIPELLAVLPDLQILVLTGHQLSVQARRYRHNPPGIAAGRTRRGSAAGGPTPVGRPAGVGTHPACPGRARPEYLRHRARTGHASPHLAAQVGQKACFALMLR